MAASDAVLYKITTKPNQHQITKLFLFVLIGSYTSLGFDSKSIASENIRRTSLAKLSALPLEAPITKVISLKVFRFLFAVTLNLPQFLLISN